MKRIGNLYEQIYDPENIKKAIRNASKGKHEKGYVRKILENSEYYAVEISEMLKNDTYRPSPNRYKTIKDGASQKERNITIPAFYPDQIIQWAIVQVLQPLFMRGMYTYCCGSVPGRGGLRAKKYIEKVQRKKDARYTLKLDIKKFFPSVSHDKLKSLLAKKIKDKKVLQLLNRIIDNGGPGLPIGYYTSQWLSNFYLQEMDHYIKEILHVKYYVRYVDDMVLLGPNKRKLRRALSALKEYLKREGYGVEIKENWQLWKTFSRPLDFVGYRFYKGYTLLRKKILYRLTKTVRRILLHGLNIRRARRFNSLVGWGCHINFKKYYLERIKPVISKRTVKRYIARYDKRKQSRLALKRGAYAS